jgi:hypothetical protein
VAKGGRNTFTHLNMRHPVVVKVGTSREALATDLALVGLLTRVNSPVGVQRAGRAEPFSADSTNVRFFTCKTVVIKMDKS